MTVRNNAIFKKSWVYAALLSAVMACSSGHVVTVDIEDDVLRNKYIEVLKGTGLQYEIKGSGEIAVTVESVDKLDALMTEYYSFRAERLKKLNNSPDQPGSDGMR